MSLDNLSVESYISAPTELDVDFPDISAELSSALSQTVSRVSDFYFVKWAGFKKIRKIMIKDGVLKPFSLRLEKKLKPRAYMRDEGEVYLSFGLMASRSSLAALSVYLHELSHVYLSQMEDYPRLKELQKEFRSRYGDNPLCEVMSPIEMYANILTIRLLREIEKNDSNEGHKKRLETIINNRHVKLEYLANELKALK